VEGPDYGSTPLGLAQFSWAFSFRRLKPAATQVRPLRGHSRHLDFDGTLAPTTLALPPNCAHQPLCA